MQVGHNYCKVTFANQSVMKASRGRSTSELKRSARKALQFMSLSQSLAKQLNPILA